MSNILVFIYVIIFIIRLNLIHIVIIKILDGWNQTSNNPFLHSLLVLLGIFMVCSVWFYYCRGPKLGVPPILLNLAGKHLQNKLQRLISTVQVKASSTKGRDLASPEPDLGRKQ
jgi:hypothetical protein